MSEKNKSQDRTLTRTSRGISGSLLFIIMDGVGLYRGKGDGYEGNALDLANAPTIKGLLENSPVKTELMAHGTAVGLPTDDDMGNSEVGHNAIGAGRVFDQGAKLVSQAISTGRIYESPTWKKLIGSQQEPGLALQKDRDRTVHFIGLLSDGNVHSHIDHLIAMVRKCSEEKVPRVRIHTLLDGRDVDEKSAHRYIEQLESVLRQIDPTGNHYCIASGGGRMNITMDRYEADWEMVERGWATHVAGEGRFFDSALQALEVYRRENAETIDQDIPPFVIARDDRPVGPIENEDVVILFNFRGDRAIEISRAFIETNFKEFSRDPDVNVHFAGMMEYDGDLRIPPEYLVTRPEISHTVSEYLSRNQVSQYAISETQKYGHVTYFWNGNNSEKFDPQYETWVEIPSDRISFDKAPQMKAKEIAETLALAMEKGEHRFYRVNFANGDMVGHTGNLKAATLAMESVDQGIQHLLDVANAMGITVVITADHGNCETMYSVKKDGSLMHNKDGSIMSKTSHTINPVPFLLTGKDAEKFKINESLEKPGLGNLASTILTLLGYELPEGYLPSVVLPVEE